VAQLGSNPELLAPYQQSNFSICLPHQPGMITRLKKRPPDVISTNCLDYDTNKHKWVIQGNIFFPSQV
jgi:hypothetical protein